MLLWGKEWTKAELLKRIGSLSQLGGISRFEYCDGKSKGVTALRVKTATGFEFLVLPEKGLDIVEASYNGRSLCWHSPVGVVHPAYYDPDKLEWLKTFAGGLVATCGLSTAGSPSEDQGQQLGQHGAISNTPAEQVNWWEEWKDDELLLTISGKVREAQVFGPNLVLHRNLQAALSGRFVRIHDTVENQASWQTPLMMLYHCNFGFPLLTDRSRLYAPAHKVEGRTSFATNRIENWDHFEPPTASIEERVYYHQMTPGLEGLVRVVLVSDDATRDFAVEMTYRADTLPQLIEWKMTGEGHFVLGIEPGNCKVDGRKREREAGTLRILEPGEKEEFQLELRVLDGAAEVAKAIAQL